MSAAPDATAVRDFFEERAALIEFDGGVPCIDAERAPLEQTATEFELTVAQVRQMLAAAAEDSR